MDNITSQKKVQKKEKREKEVQVESEVLDEAYSLVPYHMNGTPS